MNSRRINEYQLRLRQSFDTEQTRSRGLWLRADDRQFAAN
jgi:hypothetical protein